METADRGHLIWENSQAILSFAGTTYKGNCLAIQP